MSCPGEDPGQVHGPGGQNLRTLYTICLEVCPDMVFMFPDADPVFFNL